MKTFKDQEKEANNRAKWLFVSFMSAVALVLVLIIPKSCSRPVNDHENVNTNKAAHLSKKRDSVLTKTDTIYLLHTKYETRYKIVRHDSLIPCEEKLIRCDTLRYVDSTLISELNQVIKIDSSLINTWQLIHAQDSTALKDTVSYYSKQVKKSKRRGFKNGFLLGVAVGSVAREVVNIQR